MINVLTVCEKQYRHPVRKTSEQDAGKCYRGLVKPQSVLWFKVLLFPFSAALH